MWRRSAVAAALFILLVTCNEEMEVADDVPDVCGDMCPLPERIMSCIPGESRQTWPDEGGEIRPFLRNPRMPEGSLNGICKRGRQICRETEAGSEWGSFDDGPDHIGGTQDDIWRRGGMVGTVLPETDVCDGLDNDCDGRTDEGLKQACWSREPSMHVFGSPEDPYSLCRLGTQTCEDGHWSNCEGEILPSEEICDGLDNDCDGEADDNPVGHGEPCGLTDQGICQLGRLACVNGSVDLICQDHVGPQPETCNDLDDDCDGLTDEDLYKPCSSICGGGYETCQSGVWGGCTAQLPLPEMCDGLDNDCDGTVDEDLLCSCPPEAVGPLVQCIGARIECGTGFRTCIPSPEGLFMSECCLLESFLAQPFICLAGEGNVTNETCNRHDDDCDQQTDEELRAPCWSGPSDMRGVGICQDGEMSCLAGRWGSEVEGLFMENVCLGQILPSREICDGLDNDCDGEIDEGLNPKERVDFVFLLDRSGSMCDEVVALAGGVAPYVGEFVGTEHLFSLVSIPGRMGASHEVITDLVSAEIFLTFLDRWQCNSSGAEPQYDTVQSIADGSGGVSFRDNAYPMLVLMTDEPAQSVRIPRVLAPDVRREMRPCQVGDCGQEEQLELHAIVPQLYFPEWCAPADLAKVCHPLPPDITAEMVNGYLADIFREACR